VRDDVERPLDMIEMCDLLLAHASEPGALRNDPVVQGAPQRWIEVLGEAASHVSAEVRDANPQVPWRKMIGTRTILAHGYFHVDQDIIGSIVSEEIPEVRRHLAAVVESLR
jgi:uncharacterized protein with HEPN domain